MPSIEWLYIKAAPLDKNIRIMKEVYEMRNLGMGYMIEIGPNCDFALFF